jgi:putative zinc finger/helix-turn-helix YgiT family protein
MTARAKKRVPKCHGCGKPLERRFAAPRLEKMKYDGARHDVLIEGMPQWQCDGCDITLTDDESDTVAQDCLRRHIGLLTAEEIRDARTALGLTQSQLAELIGCAAESLSRWENGAILQSRSYDRLLRLFFHLPIARALLRGVGPTTQFGRIAVPGPSDPKPEILESMRILTRIWQGSADLVPSPKPQPRTSPVGGTAGHVWLEAQRHTPAERAAWGSSAALNASRTDVEWAAWEPS